MIPATQEVARALHRMKRRHARRTALLTVIAVLAVAALLMVTCFRPMQHTGRAMLPALAEGELFFVNRLNRTPEAGDVVLIAREAPEGGAMVRRVVGVAGDEVSIAANGALLLNGQPLLTIPAGNQDMPDALPIPDGCLFVLGDNTAEALDSRVASVGLIRLDEVLGVVW